MGSKQGACTQSFVTQALSSLYYKLTDFKRPALKEYEVARAPSVANQKEKREHCPLEWGKD